MLASICSQCARAQKWQRMKSQRLLQSFSANARARIAGTGKLEVLGTLGGIYVSRPVAKTLVLDWKSWLAQLFLDVFVTLCGVNEPLLDPKKLQNQQFYIINWIRKNSWSMLPIWLLAELKIMKYFLRFWEPWAGSMLVVLRVFDVAKLREMPS